MKDFIELEIYFLERKKFIKFTVVCLKNSFKITLKVLDQIVDRITYYKKLDDFFDELIKSSTEKNTKKKDSIVSAIKRLDKKHKKYLKNSLYIEKSKNTEYESLISLIEEYQYERSVKSEKKRTALIFDGYSVSLRTTIKNVEKFFEFTTPIKKSHPILTNFIKATVQLFNNRKLIDSSDANLFDF